MGLPRNARIRQRARGVYHHADDAANDSDNFCQADGTLTTVLISARIDSSSTPECGELDCFSSDCGLSDTDADGHSALCITTSTGVLG